jgi:hypothetical protein
VTGTPADPEPRSRKVPLRQAGTFFVFTLIGAVAVAVFAGDPGRAWGYLGAFALTVALGVGLAVRADQHNRAVEARRHQP